MFYELLHKKVKLKNGIEGVVIGFYQDKPDEPMRYLIEIWTDAGKKESWYRDIEFEVI
jgi:hypothetical protein